MDVLGKIIDMNKNQRNCFLIENKGHEVTLNEGDLLYFPSTYYHEFWCLTDESISITNSVFNPFYFEGSLKNENKTIQVLDLLDYYSKDLKLQNSIKKLSDSANEIDSLINKKLNNFRKELDDFVSKSTKKDVNNILAKLREKILDIQIEYTQQELKKLNGVKKILKNNKFLK